MIRGIKRRISNIRQGIYEIRHFLSLSEFDAGNRNRLIRLAKLFAFKLFTVSGILICLLFSVLGILNNDKLLVDKNAADILFPIVLVFYWVIALLSYAHFLADTFSRYCDEGRWFIKEYKRDIVIFTIIRVILAGGLTVLFINL